MTIVSAQLFLLATSAEILKSLAENLSMIRVLQVEEVYVLERWLATDLRSPETGGQFPQVNWVNH